MNDFNANTRITKLDNGVLATAGFSTEEIARLIILNRMHSEVQVLSALKALHPLMWAEITANPQIIEWEREAFARGWAPRPSGFQSLFCNLYDLGEPRGYLDSDYVADEYPQSIGQDYFRVIASTAQVDGPYGYNAFWDVPAEEMQRFLKYQKEIWDIDMRRFFETREETGVSVEIRDPHSVLVLQPMGHSVMQEPNGEVSSSKEDSDSVSPSGFSRGFSPFGSAVGGFDPEGETEPYTLDQVQQIADAFENLAEFSEEYELRGSQMRSIASGVEMTLVYSHDSRHEFDLDQRYRNRQVAEAIVDVLKLAIPAHEGAEHVEKN